MKKTTLFEFVSGIYIYFYINILFYFTLIVFTFWISICKKLKVATLGHHRSACIRPKSIRIVKIGKLMKYRTVI
jgi:hypothetical protein